MGINIELYDSGLLKVSQKSKFTILKKRKPHVSSEYVNFVGKFWGKLKNLFKSNSDGEIKTPTATAGVRG